MLECKGAFRGLSMRSRKSKHKCRLTVCWLMLVLVWPMCPSIHNRSRILRRRLPLRLNAWTCSRRTWMVTSRETRQSREDLIKWPVRSSSYRVNWINWSKLAPATSSNPNGLARLKMRSVSLWIVLDRITWRVIMKMKTKKFCLMSNRKKCPILFKIHFNSLNPSSPMIPVKEQ